MQCEYNKHRVRALSYNKKQPKMNKIMVISNFVQKILTLYISMPSSSLSMSFFLIQQKLSGHFFVEENIMYLLSIFQNCKVEFYYIITRYTKFQKTKKKFNNSFLFQLLSPRSGQKMKKKSISRNYFGSIF